jgi:hypothetical protein
MTASARARHAHRCTALVGLFGTAANPLPRQSSKSQVGPPSLEAANVHDARARASRSRFRSSRACRAFAAGATKRFWPTAPPFLWCALGLVGARPVEQKKGADKGIDGRI